MRKNYFAKLVNYMKNVYHWRAIETALFKLVYVPTIQRFILAFINYQEN